MATISAENPLAGLPNSERKKIMNKLYPNFKNFSTVSNQTRKNTRSYRNPVFAVNPMASPEVKAFIEQKKKEYNQKFSANQKKKYPNISAVNPLAGLSNSERQRIMNSLNSNSNSRRQSKKQVSFSPNTKERKTRKLPKNCRSHHRS